MSLPPEYFDALYAADADPWGFADRWYERRKYALTLAALTRQRYRSAFEAGCSIGELTAGLATRCDALLAVDVSAAALATARRRVVGQPQVAFERRLLPDEWPPGRFDLVVLSEVGYYLDRQGLDRLVTVAIDGLEHGGELVLCHWLHPVKDYPLTGEEVHAAFADRDGLARLATHVEADFRLDVYVRTPPPATSVAAREGLVPARPAW